MTTRNVQLAGEWEAEAKACESRGMHHMAAGCRKIAAELLADVPKNDEVDQADVVVDDVCNIMSICPRVYNMFASNGLLDQIIPPDYIGGKVVYSKVTDRMLVVVSHE